MLYLLYLIVSSDPYRQGLVKEWLPAALGCRFHHVSQVAQTHDCRQMP
jgi:hypothetical protein